MALVITLGILGAAAGLVALLVLNVVSSDDVRDFPDLVAAFVLALLLSFALVLFVVGAWRRNRPALVVRAFGDGAVEPKSGAALSALVQGRLLEISRSSRDSGDRYPLDFVAADVELLTEDNELAGAKAGVAEVPQLQMAAALLSFADSVLRVKRLAVGGELLTSDGKGPGLALALYDGDAVRARQALWANEMGKWSLDEVVAHVPDVYSLAAPAASWLQYETALAVDEKVELITRDGPSFALLGIGLRHQREGAPEAAKRAYFKALELDVENVGALVNLAVLHARLTNDHRSAIQLLLCALRILEIRHREPAR